MLDGLFRIQCNVMDIQAVLSEAATSFDIGAIKETSPATKGLGNGNHFVTADKGEFVLRILKNQTLDGIKNEISIETQLATVGVITPKLLAGPESKFYAEIEGSYITCSKRIEGKHPELATEDISRKIGITLARFHAAVTQLPFAGNSWLIPEAANREISNLPQDALGSEIKAQAESSLGILGAYLPRGFIHGDLHFGNLLLTEEGEIAIFDFEDAGENILILDIAMSALSLYDHNETADEELLTSLIGGYESIRQLTPLEKQNIAKAIQYASSVAASWLYNQGYTRYATEAMQNSRRIVGLIGA